MIISIEGMITEMKGGGKSAGFNFIADGYLPRSGLVQPLIIRSICPDNMIIKGFSGKFALPVIKLAFYTSK